MRKYHEIMFDSEVFPNWWCQVYGRYPDDGVLTEDIKNDFVVITSETPNAKFEIGRTIKMAGYVFVGYNNKNYDNIVLNGIMNDLSPKELKILNDLILRTAQDTDSEEHYKISKFKWRYRNFVSQDLLDDNNGPLARKQSTFGLDIRESSVSFDKENLTEEDKREIIEYCKHDVYSTMITYQKISKSYVDTKLLVGEIFNIPIKDTYYMTNAVLSGKVLGAVKKTYEDAERQDIDIPKSIENYVRYSLPSSVINRLASGPDKFRVDLFGNNVDYANGGIHSTICDNMYVETNDEWELINVDASSFYPATMIEYKTLSRSVRFPERFTQMYIDRMNYKDIFTDFDSRYDTLTKEELNSYTNYKNKSSAYKLVLNITYGASGNKWLDLYDPYMTSKTCRLGQLLLTSLANNIYNQIGKDNVFIVQTNTDGIFIYIKRKYKDLLYQIGDYFTKTTNIILEYEGEKALWQRDVSNYILQKASGRVVTKGSQFIVDIIQPNYNKIYPLDYLVCKEACIKWCTEGVNPYDYIINERNIIKFCGAADKNNSSGIVREMSDGSEQVLQKCNRIYASKNEDFGMIKLLRKYKGEIRMHKYPSCPDHCGLLNNDLSVYNIDKLDIDKQWYIDKTFNLMDGQWCQIVEGEIEKVDIWKNIREVEVGKTLKKTR